VKSAIDSVRFKSPKGSKIYLRVANMKPAAPNFLGSGKGQVRHQG
jgi:hypothetical protein